MSFVPEITFPLLYHTPKLNCNFSSCKSKLDIYKNSCYSESRHHHLGWGEQLNPIQGFLVWVCGFMELLNTLPLDILLSVKNNLHLKNHLDILFITCIQISTIWLMNSILKRCKKKKKENVFPLFPGLILERFCHSKNSKLYDPHWKRSNKEEMAFFEAKYFRYRQ